MNTTWKLILTIAIALPWLICPDITAAAEASNTPSQHAEADRQHWLKTKAKTLIAHYKATSEKEARNSWSSSTDRIILFNATAKNGKPGLDLLFQNTLIQELNKRGISVLEPEILTQVTQALQLTPDQWLDPQIQKKLAASAQAKVIVVPNESSPQNSRANVTIADSEEILIQLDDQKATDITQRPAQWADCIATVVNNRYPLQGRILNPDAGEVIINLGRHHGVTEGMIFNVLSDGIPIDLADGVAEYQYEWIGRIKVTKTATEISFAKPESRVGLWSKSQKIAVAH